MIRCGPRGRIAPDLVRSSGTTKRDSVFGAGVSIDDSLPDSSPAGFVGDSAADFFFFLFRFFRFAADSKGDSPGRFAADSGGEPGAEVPSSAKRAGDSGPRRRSLPAPTGVTGGSLRFAGDDILTIRIVSRVGTTLKKGGTNRVQFETKQAHSQNNKTSHHKVEECALRGQNTLDTVMRKQRNRRASKDKDSIRGYTPANTSRRARVRECVQDQRRSTSRDQNKLDSTRPKPRETCKQRTTKHCRRK
jgi:hypothetical protein